MPAVAMSAPDLRRWQATANEIGDGYWGAWPDTAIVDELADDVVFSMPSDGDLIEGKDAVGSLRTFIGYYAGAEPSVEAMFLSADAAAYHVSFALRFVASLDSRAARPSAICDPGRVPILGRRHH